MQRNKYCVAIFLLFLLISSSCTDGPEQRVLSLQFYGEEDLIGVYRDVSGAYAIFTMDMKTGQHELLCDDLTSKPMVVDGSTPDHLYWYVMEADMTQRFYWMPDKGLCTNRLTGFGWQEREIKTIERVYPERGSILVSSHKGPNTIQYELHHSKSGRVMGALAVHIDGGGIAVRASGKFGSTSDYIIVEERHLDAPVGHRYLRILSLEPFEELGGTRLRSSVVHFETKADSDKVDIVAANPAIVLELSVNSDESSTAAINKRVTSRFPANTRDFRIRDSRQFRALNQTNEVLVINEGAVVSRIPIQSKGRDDDWGF